MSRKIEPRNDWENHFKWNKGVILRVLLLTVILRHPVYLPSALEPSIPGDGLESSCFPLLGNQPSLRPADQVWGFDMRLYTISGWVWQVEWFLQIWNDHFCSNLQIKRGTVQPCHFSEKNIGWLKFFCRALSTDQLLHLQPSSSSSSAGEKLTWFWIQCFMIVSSVRSSNSHSDLLVTHQHQQHPTFSDNTLVLENNTF